MREHQSRVLIKSDVSGKELAENASYQVAVVFNNKKYVIDIDADNLIAELEGINVADVIRRGHEVESFTRNSRESLTMGINRRARAWAQEQGMDVGDRGAVPHDVVKAYVEHCRNNDAAAEVEGYGDLF